MVLEQYGDVRASPGMNAATTVNLFGSPFWMFSPEVNTPATRTCEHCVHCAAERHEVTVVTCSLNCPDGVGYSGYRNRLRPQVEMVEGVRGVRIWTYLASNASTVRRIANNASHMLSALLAALRLARPDVVAATSPQFFCGWAGVLVHWFCRVPFVLGILDNRFREPTITLFAVRAGCAAPSDESRFARRRARVRRRWRQQVMRNQNAREQSDA